MSTLQLAADTVIRPLTLDELDLVSGGEVTIVAEKGYVGIEISVGGYGIAVWATQGSVCGQVKTPGGIHSGCTP